MKITRYFCKLRDDYYAYLDVDKWGLDLSIVESESRHFDYNISRDSLYDLFITYLELTKTGVPFIKSSYTSEVWVTMNSNGLFIRSNKFKSKKPIIDRIKYLFDK